MDAREKEMIEAGREFLKNVPSKDIVEVSKKRYPQITLQALSGDKEAMLELYESFAEKAAEFFQDGYIEEARVLFSTGVFWHDKAYE